jgi:hypothetical protein
LDVVFAFDAVEVTMTPTMMDVVTRLLLSLLTTMVMTMERVMVKVVFVLLFGVYAWQRQLELMMTLFSFLLLRCLLFDVV